MLISFSGIDGAGKSTQIANLQSYLRGIGLQVKLITFWDDVATLKQVREDAGHKLFSGDKGVGSPEAPIHRRDKNVRSPLMTFVRLCLYFFDALSLRGTVKSVLRSNADVVIFDRYLYDELANLDLQSAPMRCYMRAISRLASVPQISFILDADPAQARARKPEYPLEFLYSNRDSYLRLSRLLHGITVIPPLPLNEAKLEVMRYVKTQLDRQSACPVGSNSSGMEPGSVYQ